MSERQKDGSLWPLLLGVSAVGVGLVLAGALFFSRYVTRQMSQSVPRLGAPRDFPAVESAFRFGMYPTARRVLESQAKIAVELPTNGSFQVASSEYVTHDEMDEVIAYYRHTFENEKRERAGSSYTERAEDGGFRWIMKEGATYRIVAVKPVEGHPHIRLVWIEED